MVYAFLMLSGSFHMAAQVTKERQPQASKESTASPIVTSNSGGGSGGGSSGGSGGGSSSSSTLDGRWHTPDGSSTQDGHAGWQRARDCLLRAASW